MAARSLATSTITFGLVTVPVRVYPATRESAGISFHLLHAKDGVRLRQQLVCPKDDEVVARKEAVKGYEYAKEEYVILTDDELDAVDQKASAGIEVSEARARAETGPSRLSPPRWRRRASSPSANTRPVARTTWWRSAPSRSGC
jgi:DNA end-binding protein Ku